MQFNQALITRAARRIWFRPGKVRTCFRGPYSGIHFELVPALLDSRMAVFYRAYEPEVTKLLGQIVRPGQTLFDIGAHVGVHTLYMCKLLAGRGRIFAFEPWPENFADLVHNLRCNSQITNIVTPVPVGVAEHTQMMKFEEGQSDGKHRISNLPNGRLLPTISLDSFCEDTNAVPDVIKIDIEGQELNALKGGTELLRRHRPHLVLEHHHLTNELRTLLTTFGYTVTPIGGRHLHAQFIAPS